VDYRLIARPLLERLGAIRGTVELMVLRPPTLALLDVVLATAVSRGNRFTWCTSTDMARCRPAWPGRPAGRTSRPVPIRKLFLLSRD